MSGPRRMSLVVLISLMAGCDQSEQHARALSVASAAHAASASAVIAAAQAQAAASASAQIAEAQAQAAAAQASAQAAQIESARQQREAEAQQQRQQAAAEQQRQPAFVARECGQEEHTGFMGIGPGRRIRILIANSGMDTGVARAMLVSSFPGGGEVVLGSTNVLVHGQSSATAVVTYDDRPGRVQTFCRVEPAGG